jgi:7-carboxy-7-deazaguanine synthase (Cx14CxxC type)
MSFYVKEIFYTLQGEGVQTGRAAVFCRFVGCNLWSGQEEDRQNAICKFCDTDFIGTSGPDGGKFDTETALADRIEQTWRSPCPVEKKFVVFTGGEPLLQLNGALIDAMHARNFEVAVETNGTVAAPRGLDWICVSPKAGTRLVQNTGNELKLVFPQVGVQPEDFQGLVFQHFFLQPMDGPHRKANTDEALRYCLGNPTWRLSLQTHKFVGIR